jgi:hypothetical protein
LTGTCRTRLRRNNLTGARSKRNALCRAALRCLRRTRSRRTQRSARSNLSGGRYDGARARLYGTGSRLLRRPWHCRAWRNLHGRRVLNGSRLGGSGRRGGCLRYRCCSRGRRRGLRPNGRPDRKRWGSLGCGVRSQRRHQRGAKGRSKRLRFGCFRSNRRSGCGYSRRFLLRGCGSWGRRCRRSRRGCGLTLSFALRRGFGSLLWFFRRFLLSLGVRGSRRGSSALRFGTFFVAFGKQFLLDDFCDVRFDGTRMRLLFRNSQIRKQVQDGLRLYFQLPGQLVNANHKLTLGRIPLIGTVLLTP